ncbi:hypothetical protein M707_02750 [Arthrobacter sp. AK-YN10]|nr:hypothetical protein M707_02750 [Arthrobacter sp. AK-YN10]
MSTTPQDFDLDAWLDGADRPQRSVTVYQKAGLIADLDALAERIELAEAEEEVDGPSMGGGAQKLRAEYAALAQQFHDSALTVRVQGHSDDERDELRSANPKLGGGEMGRLILADALVSPKFTAEQVARFEKVIGPAQFAAVLGAYRRACSEVPVVSADFLPKSSTLGDGRE